MNTKIDLFGSEQAQRALANMCSLINGLPKSNDFENSRNRYIATILASMRVGAAAWNQHCELNIGWIGNAFIGSLDDQIELDGTHLNEIFSKCFRFLSEFYLSTKNEFVHELSQAYNFGVENIGKFDANAQQNINFALHAMPISILKSLLTDEQAQSIKSFNEIAALADTKKIAWESEISQREQKVEEIKLSLEKYESGFNFVGLYQGFDELSNAKQIERKSVLFWIKIIGFLILTPFLIELAIILINQSKLAELQTALLVSLVPVISIVAILIYYFRVLLHHYNALKSQILQLELRKTLCRFIQSYAGFSKNMKEQNNESLAKFENIIFSGLVSSDDKLPSTFDGLEQLGNLVKTLKG